MSYFDVVILTWDNWHLTKECFNKISKTAEVDTSYIIVDNGSILENKQKLLELLSKKVTIIFNNDNRGFAGGVNQAIKLSIAPYIFLLNNDVMWKERWGENILQEFNQDEKLGILGELEIFNKERIEKHLALNGLKWKGELNLQFSLISGHIMIIARKVIEQIGLFDEQFFPGLMEDVDFSLRAINVGFKIKQIRSHFRHLSNSALYEKFSHEQVNKIVADTSRKFFLKHFGKHIQ